MTEAVVSIPRWVLNTVCPLRTREAVSGRVRSEARLAVFTLATIGGIAAFWGRSRPLPPFLLVLVAGTIGAIVRGMRIRAARQWLDRTQAWSSLAPLPKSPRELRLERRRVPDVLFWSVVVTFLVAAITVVLILGGR